MVLICGFHVAGLWCSRQSFAVAHAEGVRLHVEAGEGQHGPSGEQGEASTQHGTGHLGQQQV